VASAAVGLERGIKWCVIQSALNRDHPSGGEPLARGLWQDEK
jgi:hypothetical protein